MARYLLDTGVMLGYLRGSPYAEYIEQKFSPLSPPNISVISVVTIAEMRSLALQRHWGNDKINRLRDLLAKLPVINVYHEEILDKYAEIDAFSLGRHPSRKLPGGTTARPMGKNDLWIAATASVTRTTLITLDLDFHHLNNEFIELEYVDRTSQP